MAAAWHISLTALITLLLSLYVSDSQGEFFHLGYYDAGNQDRPCLTLSPKNITTSDYTHVVFAYAEVDEQHGITLNPAWQPQFDEFKVLTGVKRVIAVGRF